jgi:hypothetical protein
MDLPTFLDIDNDDSQRAYQQELNQSLRTGLSNNGWTVPQVTNAQLTTTPVIDPATGASTTLAAMMPNGTLWFVLDAVPPCYVGKLSGSLVKFTTTAYP